MDLNRITEGCVREALRAVRAHRPLPAVLLELHLLDSVQGDQAARALYLQEHLRKAVIEALSAQRFLEDLPPLDENRLYSRQEMLTALRQDFQCGNVVLEAYSALYHRYLCPVMFSHEVLADAALVSERQLRRRITYGIRLLVDALRAAEREAWREFHRQQLRAHLPLRESPRLFGVQRHIETLRAWLEDPQEHPIISIEGLGGIGKTALALAVMETFLDDDALEAISWVSARQNWLDLEGDLHETPHSARTLQDVFTRLAAQLGLNEVAGLGLEDKAQALKKTLRSAPHLVVVDNLESVEDVQELLPALFEIAGKSRILLTTRQSVRAYPFVRCFTVPELDRQAALALWMDVLNRRARRVKSAVDAFEQVYALIGGLPLALKLVAAQLAYLPLDTLARHLQTGGATSQAHLYTYIYRHTWMMLDDAARRLLLSMLWVSPEGEDADWLRHMSDLPEALFTKALRQLQEFSLLDVSGSISSPRYHIHRLTGTFLHTEILQHWEQEA